MRKNYNEVINNLKSEIINSIIEEFETYNKNEVEFYVDVDDEFREDEFTKLCFKMVFNDYEGSVVMPNKLIKNEDGEFIMIYEIGNEEGDIIGIFTAHLNDTDFYSVDNYSALLDILSNEDLKMTNKNNYD